MDMRDDKPTAVIDAHRSGVLLDFANMMTGRLSTGITSIFYSEDCRPNSDSGEGGKIREPGSHEELLATGVSMPYAFEVQATGYR